MPLHRNESHAQDHELFRSKPVNICKRELHAIERKSNCHDSSGIAPRPEYLFKGKGIRVKVNPPKGSNVQCPEKGSYRLGNMIQFIEKLPALPYQLFPSKRRIFILDGLFGTFRS